MISILMYAQSFFIHPFFSAISSFLYVIVTQYYPDILLFISGMLLFWYKTHYSPTENAQLSMPSWYMIIFVPIFVYHAVMYIYFSNATAAPFLFYIKPLLTIALISFRFLMFHGEQLTQLNTTLYKRCPLHNKYPCFTRECSEHMKEVAKDLQKHVFGKKEENQSE
jgi:hypothetical protein